MTRALSKWVEGGGTKHGVTATRARPSPTGAFRIAALGLCLAGLLGCDDQHGASERRQIRSDDMPVALRIVRTDLNNGMVGVREAAHRVRRGFLVEDRAQREREMRMVLRRLQQPPRSINELMVSPISFVAAVDLDGKVICRDADPDLMRGFDLGEVAPVIGRAIEGEAGYELSRLPTLNPEEEPSVTVIFAAPAMHEGRVVGVIAAGLPLWRLAQQMTRQLQLENAAAIQRGELVWVLMYENDDLHYHAGFPPDLRALVPSRADRNRSLAASPGGYTGELQQFGRWYGYGVLPTPTIGERAGIVLFRSHPM